jgi:hypothetical protein
MLKAGQVLIAHGGFAHYGFSTAKSETHSLASNMVTEDWFRTGGPQFLVRYYDWVKTLQQIKDLDKHLQEHGLTTEHLANALNQCHLRMRAHYYAA